MDSKTIKTMAKTMSPEAIVKELRTQGWSEKRIMDALYGAKWSDTKVMFAMVVGV